MRMLLLALKILFLGFLYIFLFRALFFIVTDLRRAAAASGPEPFNGGYAPGSASQFPGHGPGAVRAAHEPARAELIVTESRDPALKQGDVQPVEKSVLIGRGRQNNVRMKDAFVSHNHARIIFRHGQYLIEDLGSVNGTYINGVRIKEPVQLRHGDTVKIAGVTFKFVRWEHEVE